VKPALLLLMLLLLLLLWFASAGACSTALACHESRRCLFLGHDRSL
jgi:hypothetical protein